MVKFIPLTCEVCGGELSVKEDLKFVTCLHCHTKFQVLHEEKTAYLEKLDINVNVETNIYRETCEIVFQYPVSGKVKFWALGLNKDGEFNAGKSWIVNQHEFPYKVHSSHEAAHRCLSILLSKSGWTRTGKGQSWYADLFERSAPSDDKAKVFELEKRFGEQLFETIYNGKGLFFKENFKKRLWENDIVERGEGGWNFFDSNMPSILMAMYKQKSQRLEMVLFNQPDPKNGDSYQKLIDIRKEIETLQT